jgi:nucleoid-associated protein YgaU
MEKYIKNFLKKIKLNEQSLSTLLGALVILIVGVLIFNYFKTGGQTDLVLDETQEQTIESTESAQLTLIPNSYTVEANDSLWKISEKFYNTGYKWIEIAEANNLSNPNYLEVGQEINLPELEVNQEQATALQQQEKQAITGDDYTVQEGDSLWKIAVRAYEDGYKWVEIAEANNLSNPNYIEENQVLSIPR